MRLRQFLMVRVSMIALVAMAALFCAQPATAADWKREADTKALKAYAAGDYATALAEFLPLAKQGHIVAQYYLGLMYDEGQGVNQDYAEALKWYRRAAERGRYTHKTISAICITMVEVSAKILPKPLNGIDWPPIRGISGQRMQ